MATVLAVVIVPYVVLMAAAWLFQRHLIYIPDRIVPTPDAVGLTAVETVSFTSGDGITLAGWFIAARPSPSRGTVIVLNGNGGNRAYRAMLAAALAPHGLSTLLFDYRGYGGNAGTPSEAGLVRDAHAALDYALSRQDVDPNHVIYFGESLGGSVATALAAARPPSALILRSPFASLADVARYHYPFLPVGWLLRERYPTVELIRQVTCRTLVIVGDADRIVPASQTRLVFDAAAGPKRLLTLEGADHNDLEMLFGERVIKTIVEFVDRVSGN